MQKKSVRVSILSSIALILMAMLCVFGFGKFQSVKAANNMGAMTAVVITVDNETNGYISERPLENLDEEDIPIMLNSYTELVGAEIRDGYLFLKGASDGIAPTVESGINKYYTKVTNAQGVEVDAVVMYSGYLKKCIWFKTQYLSIPITNIRTNEFTYTYNGIARTITTEENITDGSTYNITLGFLGEQSGTLSIAEDEISGTWTSTNFFETHEALLIRIGSSTSSIRYDIDAQTLTLNGESIDGYGKIEEAVGSYYYKEYHGIPAEIVDECGINVAAKTRRVRGNTDPSNYLNTLEGYYKLNITYRTQVGAPQISNFNFYLITSNTYANTDEILTFYNTNSQTAAEDDEEYTKLHYFNHNNLDNNQLLDIATPIELDQSLIAIDSSGLTYNGTTYPNDLPNINIYNAMNENTFDGKRGIIYNNNLTQKWMFADRLLYPTLTFNPEKYDLQYQKVWYNTEENGEFDFETLDALYGVMSVYTVSTSGTRTLKTSFDVARKTDELEGVDYSTLNVNNSDVLVRVTVNGTPYQATNGLITIDGTNYYYNKVEKKVCKYDLDAPFIAKYTMEELGEYVFLQQYKLKISNNEYYVTKNINDSSNISDKNEKLVINGYQATYRNNGTTTSYLRNENFVSDFSYLLTEPVYTSLDSESKAVVQPNENISYAENNNDYIITIEGINYYIDATKITTTNQAPVSLRYFATPNNKTANGKSLLWYVHIDNNKNITRGDYSNSKSFSTAGLYVVFLSFVDSSDSSKCCEQMIAFKITNSQPEVSIQTTDYDNITILDHKGSAETAITSNSYTNKNVYIQWLNNDVFNANIYATYTQYDFSGNIVRRNAPLTGLIYYKDESVLNNNTTLFTENGRYVVNIYYTNSGSSINRSFIIDKTSISGIKAVQVNVTDRRIFGYDSSDSTLTNATLSDQTNFNLVVKDAFAWTWNSKSSGAKISARYYYSNIAGKSSFALDNIEKDGENWVLANGEFGEILTGTNYAHTELSTTISTTSEAIYWKDAMFDSSQIISTNCMAILVLKDEAGNTASFVTIYESITPQTIQKKVDSSERTTSTLISATTEFIFGSHKALSVAKGSARAETINTVFAGILDGTSTTFSINSSEEYALPSNICSSLQNTFKSYSNELYYTLPIKRAESRLICDETYEVTIAPTKIGSNYTRTSLFVVLQQSGNSMFTYISTSATGSPLSARLSLDVYGQIQFTLTTVDNLENKITLNKNISLDQSDGRIFSHSGKNPDTSAITDTTTFDNKRNANRQQVFVGYSTNRDLLTFSFLQQPSGNFRVESIKLEYYELNLNLKNISENDVDPLYPYNTTPIKYTLYSINSSDPTVGLNWNATEGDGGEIGSGTYLQSDAINLTSNGVTAPGKYVFIRKYETDISSLSPEENKNDKTTFEYTVYVDRNGVISNDMTINIGVKGVFSNYEESETYKEFNSFGSQKNAQPEFRNNFIYNGNTASRINFNQTKTNLSTDMLPAKIALEIINGIAYKYYYNYDNKQYYSTQKNSQLIVIVQKFGDSNIISSQTLYSSAITQSHNTNVLAKSEPIQNLNAQSFSDAGIYRVFVMDLANINIPLTDSYFTTDWASGVLGIWDSTIYNSNFTPNVGTFSFKLRKEDIATSVLIKNAGVDTYTNVGLGSINGQNYYYTQNNNVIFSFSDTIDEYKAKVQYKNWTLTRTVHTLVNGTMQERVESPVSPNNVEIRTYDPNNEEANILVFSENELNRIKGVATTTPSTMTFSTKDNEGGILYYRTKFAGLNDDRYTYYILLPSNVVGETKTDCSYSLTLSYLGNPNSYMSADNQTNYFSKTTQAYIDNTAPYKHLLSLINQDTYLTSAQKSDMIANLNNPNYEFLTYYAFAVGPTFSLEAIDDSENIDCFYYKKVSGQKYDGSQNPKQTVIPESENFDKYADYRFNETFYKKYYLSSTSAESGYNNSITSSAEGSGYYDIIEVDKAGNHRVYTIYLNGDGVSINTTATDENNSIYEYNFISSFAGTTPTYEITSNGVTIYSKTGIINYDVLSDIPSISNSSFVIEGLSIQDEWYTINYRLMNGVDNAPWQTLVAAPQIYSNITGITYNTKAQNIAILNDFISQNIENGKLSSGTRMEFMIVNRGGNNLRFYLLTPGVGLVINNISPTLVGNRYFTVTIPADTYSTKFSDFRVTQNSVLLSTDHNSPPTYISNIKSTRETPVMLRFLLGNYRYSISFKDNFGRSYEFIYPTTEGIVNELVFEDGTTPKYVDGVLYTSNTSTFNYTTGTRDRISIKIVDKDTNIVIADLNNLPYSSAIETDVTLKTELQKEEIMPYMTEKLNMNNSVVSITFNAIKNRHLVYEITLLDIDNNLHTRVFAIYTKAQTITLTDTVGIEIFNDDLSDKITSKTVVVRYSTPQNVLFNPQVKLFDGTNTTNLSSSAQIRNAGEYRIFIANDLGIMNVFTIEFTIKPATTDIYSVYFADELLSAHSVKYNFEIDSTTKLIDSYFFLSSSNNAWNDIQILPSEDKDLTTELITTSGNTKIYKIFGNVYEDYFAVTQIFPVANNHLTNFEVYITTDLTNYISSSVGSGDHQYLIEPTTGKATYAKLHWDTSEAGFKNFVFANIWYNNVYMGKYTDDVVLTKSGEYTIQIMDIVGQQHRFGTQNRDAFTLTILNNVNYKINNANPIENQTFNDQVTLTLMNEDRYSWNSGGFIKVLRNNQEETNYITQGRSWTFTLAGYYSVYIETPISSNTTTPIKISATAHFTILDKNESKTVYDFAKISGYSVTKVEKIEYNSDLAELINLIVTNATTIDADSSYSAQVLNSFKQYNENVITQNNITTVTQLAEYLNSIDSNSLLYTYIDVTPTIKSIYETEVIQSFKITPDNLGVGRYRIYVKVEGSELTAAQSYSYDIWINNEEPTLTSSRAFGSSSTSSFIISFNPSIIYSQIGNSYIKINNTIIETINDSNQANVVRSYRVSAPGTYLVQVYSNSGSLISSQRITIDVPLNTAAIILIVVAVIVVVGVIVIFILFRTRMKVK